MIKKIKGIVHRYIHVLNMDPRVTALSEQPVREKKDTPRWVHIALFLATLVTTTVAGASSYESIPAVIISGLPFSITIMTILLAHEMGHFITARHFGMKATLPYFIPFPSLIGTMGAVIKIKSPMRSNRALLLVGAMGPVTGFVLSLIAVIAGMFLSEVRLLPPVTGDMAMPVFGDSILFASVTYLVHGPIPPGYDIFLSPYAWAGWIGCLVTSLNLMPLGQLDGGHILYALIGRKQLYAGWAVFGFLVILSFVWPGWLVWVFITLFFLMVGHPVIRDNTELSRNEKLLGWSCMIILVLTFIPVPVQLIECNTVYPIQCDSCSGSLEPSGIALIKGRIHFVSDNPEDRSIYLLKQKGNAYAARPLQLFDFSGFSARKTGHSPDLEGLLFNRGNLYAVDERNRLIFRISKQGRFTVLRHDIARYNASRGISFSDDSNAGFEGIACNEEGTVFYIANEREKATVYILKKKGDRLVTTDHIFPEAYNGGICSDISDLFYEKGHLYILSRNERRILKLDLKTLAVCQTYSYLAATKGLYHSPRGYGFAEALTMDRSKIYLLLDSNGQPFHGNTDGRHGALVILPRPDNF
jgi:Zn-dependent protease